VAEGDLVSQFADAFSRRDLAGLQALVTEDFVMIPIRAALEDISYRGRDGVLEWVRAVDESWSELRVEIDQVEKPRPDTVVVLGRTVGRGMESAAPVEVECTWVAKVREGRLARLETFLDRDEGLRAAAAES
jgi:ketosteroid isomerase-like protein